MHHFAQSNIPKTSLSVLSLLEQSSKSTVQLSGFMYPFKKMAYAIIILLTKDLESVQSASSMRSVLSKESEETCFYRRPLVKKIFRIIRECQI